MNAHLGTRLSLDRPRLQRHRAVLACQPCQKRKVKCDQSKPHCQRCMDNNRICSYHFDNKKNTRPSPPRDNTRPRGQFGQTTARPKDNTPLDNESIALGQSSCLSATYNTQSRYISSSSWKSTVLGTDSSDRSSFPDGLSTLPPDPPITLSAYDSTSSTDVSVIVILNLVRLGEVHRLLSWYQQHCQLWYPVVNMPKIFNIVENLENQPNHPESLWSLVSAICYSAACSNDACGDPTISNFSTLSWKDLSLCLLSTSGYPLDLNEDSIRAAILLAVPTITESDCHPNPEPICTLLRASQSLGLHRDPSCFKLSPHECDARRVLWWSIHTLDLCYSLAHALPPLIHSTKFDVHELSEEGGLNRGLMSTLSRINPLLINILDEIYGISVPTEDDVRRLDEEVMSICTSEISKSRSRSTESTTKFVGISQRLCCWKVIYMLHQPYLRTEEWPRSSRTKALDASRNYINEFIAATVDPELKPYKWVLNHFNAIHSCAILLQDLVQYPNSAEFFDLRQVVETCFEVFSTEPGTDWQKLQELRMKAWASNQWSFGEPPLDGYLDSLASLSDWDPWFASLNFGDILSNSRPEDLSSI